MEREAVSAIMVSVLLIGIYTLAFDFQHVLGARSVTPFGRSRGPDTLLDVGDPPYQGLWMVGDGHMHTIFSDGGPKTVEDRAEEARENGLDFIIITDHHFDFNTREELYAYYDAVESVKSSYPDIRVLWGLEWTLSDHILAYGITPEDLEPYIGRWWVTPQEAITVVHSAGGVAYMAHPWSTYPGLAGMENMTGFEGHNRPDKQGLIEVGAMWDQLLTAGKRYFIIGNNDAHGEDEAGQYVATFVYCPNATEAGIIEGYRRGCIYYSECIPVGLDYRPVFKIEFTVDNTWMGQTISEVPSESTVHLWINVTIVNGAGTIDTVTVIQDGMAKRHILGGGSTNVTQYLDLTSTGSYFRIVANDTEGNYAASNPVFLQRIPGVMPVHNINTGLNYSMIQSAINAPQTLDGHTIIVDAGTYYENVFLYKSLTLIGENPETTIVDGGGTGDGIHVVADNVTISGLTFQNGFGGISLDRSSGDTITNNVITLNSLSGIEHYHSNNNIIGDNKVTLNSHAGIWLINSSNSAITHNNVSNNSWQGILLGDSSDHNEVSNNLVIENGNTGIIIINSLENSVSYNNATLNVYCGIQLGYSENSNVKKNVVTLNSIGIMLHASKHNVIEDNKATHNGEGILLAFSNCNIVEANEAVENGGNGIRLYNSSYNEVSHNNASLNDTGIVLETSSNNNILVGNNVASNFNGILVGYSSNNNTIYHNNFLHNTVQVVHITSGCVNVWDDGYPSGGNYWSDYAGMDLYHGSGQGLPGSDGIGDTPYVIDADNQDNYPLMKPFGTPIQGDVNSDGIVDIYDIIIWAKALGSELGDPGWDTRADLYPDGVIDIFDGVIIAQNFGQTYP